MVFAIELTDEALNVLEQYSHAETGSRDQQDMEAVLQGLVSEYLTKSAKTFARQRLNLLKKQIKTNINRGIKGYESLEQSYITLGLGPDVETFGGIAEVYQKIWDKRDDQLPPSKIRLNYERIEFVKAEDVLSAGGAK